jgi:predicted Zn-dependent protease
MSMQKLSMVLCMAALIGLPMKASAFSLKTTESGVPVRWQQARVELRIDPRLEQAFGAQAVKRAAVVAGDAWRGLANAPDVVIADGAPAPYDANERNNGIYLLAEWPFEHDQVAMTITSYTTYGEIVGVDILVNGTRAFEMLPEPSNGAAQHDLAAVLTHEIGHALGLAHSHEDPDATMYPHIRAGETHQRSLSADDEAAIEQAYAAAMPVVADEARVSACTAVEGAGSGAAGSWMSAAMAMLGAALVIRRRG